MLRHVLAVPMFGWLLAAGGCLWGGPEVVPPAEHRSASARLDSPVSERMREEASPTVTTTAVAASKPLAATLEATVALRPWRYIVLHHTATEAGDVETIDSNHRQRIDAAGNPWLGIGYHFVIGNGQGMADGEVQPTFRWREQLHGAHAGERPYNELGIGICLVGNFEEQPPTPRQMKSVKQLVATLATEFHIASDNIMLHRDVAVTDCPGKLFPFDEVRQVAAGNVLPHR